MKMKMKIGILSDLHCEFSHYPWLADYNALEPDPDGVEQYIIAGDIDTNSLRRARYICQNDEFDKRFFYILGNHDYWNREWLNPYNTMKSKVLPNGLKIAGATLWCDLSNYVHWGDNQWMMADAQNIDNYTYDNYNNTHQIHKKFLLESGADIIVSHHAPSYGSLHPRYIGNAANPGFITELKDDILNMQKPPKLWVHGHVHDPFDYMIGETRVVCWPRGYPSENGYYDNYFPKIVEIDV